MGARQRNAGVVEQGHRHPRRPARNDQAGDQDEKADYQHQQAYPDAEQSGARDKRRERDREHSHDRREVAAGVFDHGRHGIILCRAHQFAGLVATLGERIIKIKYLVGRFIADVCIIHTVYVPRPAA